MSMSTDERFALREQLSQKIAAVIHHRMHVSGFLPGPFHPRMLGDRQDKSKSHVSIMSAYDILDLLEKEGYSLVQDWGG